MDLVQHDRVGLLLRHEYLEPQGAYLGCQATLGEPSGASGIPPACPGRF
jgi:hypothetical protein